MSEKLIGERTFIVEPMLATTSLLLKARIMQLIGGAAGRIPEIVRGAGPNASDDEKRASDAAAVAAFTDIFTNGDPAQMVKLVTDICEIAKLRTATEDIVSVNFDRDFTGKEIDMFHLVIFVLKEVFGDFLDAALGLGSLSLAPTGSAPKN